MGTSQTDDGAGVTDARRSPAGPVLVAVADPDHVQQLVRTAGDLARVGDGVVRLVTVAVKGRDSPFRLFDDETIRREFARDSRELLAQATPPADVTVEREVVPASSVRAGIRTAVADADPAALVVGWAGPVRRSDAVLGTTVDDLLRRAACDLYVERIGREAGGVETVLLPVAGGPNVTPAAAAAKAIAARNRARVLVFSVATDDATGNPAAAVDAGRAAVETAAGPPVTVESRVGEGTDVAAAIVRAGRDADVIVIGATRKRGFRRRLVGSVPRRVAAGTDRTVVLARAGGLVQRRGLGGRLGRLLGR
jgi:nucleotide-binding universal stress UspA family protein